MKFLLLIELLYIYLGVFFLKHPDANDRCPVAYFRLKKQ